MKMIKYSFFSISLITCLMLGGCEDFLNRPSLSDLSQDGFFGARRDIDSWQAGIYYQLQTTMNTGHLAWGDLRADLYDGIREYVNTRIYFNGLDATQSEYSWQNLYKTVMLCNTAIEFYPKVPGVSEADYNDYLGQAYGLRALMYFYAIRVWDRVPIVDKLWNGVPKDAYVPRSEVSEVKKLIQSDIDEAIKLLNNNVTAARKYAFNRAAAYALKADVHLWFGENAEALDATEWFFIGTNPTNYKLIAKMDDYRTIFTDPTASTETIFTLYWNTGESGRGCDWCGQLGTKGGQDVSANNPFKISRTLYETFVNRVRSGNGTDARFIANYDTVGMYNNRGTPGNRPALSSLNFDVAGAANQSPFNKNIKYSPPVTGNPPATGTWYIVLPLTIAEGSADGRCQILWPVYRLADVYLLRAEALNRLGRGADALKIVNQIRTRVGYTLDATTEVNPNSFKDVEWLILEERKLEFIAEGRRWFDLIRTDRVLEVMDPVLRARQSAWGYPVEGFTDPERKWAPINSRDLEANPALDQNKAYTGGGE